MSIRTVIEINHDFLHDLREGGPEHLEKLLTTLSSCGVSKFIESTMHVVPGVRVLAQRHHSEEITLKVK